MTHPRVAVVITCFNLGRMLEDALGSALSQTLPPAEIVIVDDGSTDLFTQEFLLRIARGGHRVVRTENCGVSAARNRGIRSTTAPYVVLLDADDTLDPTYLEKASARLEEQSELSFVSCGMRCVGAADEVWTPPEPELIESMTRGVVHISSMFRREMWQHVGGFDETFAAHEELDFWTTAIERGFQGVVLSEPLLNYRVRRHSMYQAAIQQDSHLGLMERFYRKHFLSLQPRFEDLLLAKEGFILEQRAHHERLSRRKEALRRELDDVHHEITATVRQLSELGGSRVDLGDLRRTSPISPVWGLDRGIPLDRYYIHAFLDRHRNDICGRVAEVKDSGYARLFGDDRVASVDVLDIDPANEQATVIVDLSRADAIADATYDCFILTHTLGLIFDAPRAVAHACRILKPGGVLLCTVPAIGRLSYEGLGIDGDYWRFTEASVRRMFSQAFPLETFEVTVFGNVLAGAAFLYGLALDELTPAELDVVDPFFPVAYGIRAVKPQIALGGTRAPAIKLPARRYRHATSAAILMYHGMSVGPDDHRRLCVTADVFRAQMQALRDAGYRVAPLRELAAAVRTSEIPDRLVSITFDDGYLDALTSAAPILAEFSFPATFFVVGRSLDGIQEFWWDALGRILRSDRLVPPALQLSLPTASLMLPTVTPADRSRACDRLIEGLYQLPSDIRDAAVQRISDWAGVASPPETAIRPMTPDELIRLASMPGVSIGAHSETHAWLPGLQMPLREAELRLVKSRLERLLGSPVTSFAYPYGGHDPATLNLVADAGFTEAVTVEPGRVGATADPLALPRYDANTWQHASPARLERFVGRSPQPTNTNDVRTLVAGWFSFEEGHATAGDFLARDLACEWLKAAGHPFDIALAAPFAGGVDWRTVDPAEYPQVVFVCGPFARGKGWELSFLERFGGSRLIGLNLSMLVPLQAWQPFDVLLERDSSARARPDITFLSPSTRVPVVGVCLMEPYQGGATNVANAAIERLLSAREVAVVEIDTRLDVNATGLRTAGEVESVLAHMDMVITTRLHGMALALKNGVPVLAIDPQPGGGKVLKQAQAIGWPWVFAVDSLTDDDLQRGMDACLAEHANREATACARRAAIKVEKIKNDFVVRLSRRCSE